MNAFKPKQEIMDETKNINNMNHSFGDDANQHLKDKPNKDFKFNYQNDHLNKSPIIDGL